MFFIITYFSVCIVIGIRYPGLRWNIQSTVRSYSSCVVNIGPVPTDQHVPPHSISIPQPCPNHSPYLPAIKPYYKRITTPYRMQLGLSENLSALVARRFTAAKEGGHLIFSPTQLSNIQTLGIPVTTPFSPQLDTQVYKILC